MVLQSAPLPGHGHDLSHSDDVEMMEHPASFNRTSADHGVFGEKSAATADVNSVDSLGDREDEIMKSTKSTAEDAAGMKRMGKQQQLVRHFRFVSTVSFVALATAAWEIGLFVITPGLVDGGRAGLVWNVLWNIVGFGPIYLSMAEVSKLNGRKFVEWRD